MNKKTNNRHRRNTSVRSKGRGGTRGASRRGKFHGSRKKSLRRIATFDPSQFINKSPASQAKDVYEPKHQFSTFGLSKRLVSVIEGLGMVRPTPIQDQIIPEILLGHDVVGLAETGTGKTAAFLIPLIEKTLKNENHQTLILAPTRELAIQIEEELKNLSRGMGIFSVSCVGGMNIRPQIRALRDHNHFIIGTPGRLLDLLNRKKFSASGVATVVLDEADRMLDMGFINDIRSILAPIPKERETLLFSATMSGEADKIVKDFLRNPVFVSVKKKDVASGIEQDVIYFEYNSKFNTLLKELEKPGYDRVLVFGSMKHSVEKLARQLSKQGIRAESIHGNKSHPQRQKALLKFKNGKARVLVATDVAARGIHVEDVTHVINYDLPNTLDDYIHRIGRTGRSTKQGKALTFVPATSTYSHR